VILAGARRLAVVVAVLVGGTAAVASLVGLATGTSLDRAISLGMYLVGSFCAICGFALTIRGALRPGAEHDEFGYEGTSRNAAALLVSLGLLIVVIGLIIDSRVRVL
jgi:hypothetical protein